MRNITSLKTTILAITGLLCILSIFMLFRLRFSFDFEQFFPDGDEDLAFFREFTKEFEGDDNFLLIGIRRAEGAFDSSFLASVHDLTLKSRDLPYVEDVQSLTKMGYPLKTPFGITAIPVIHLQQPDQYPSDWEKIKQDDRFIYNLISKDGKTLVIYLKTTPKMQLGEARKLMVKLNALVDSYDFQETHLLGRAYFQTELVAMQQREILVSFIVSGLLVSIILWIIFRHIGGVLIATGSLVVGMLLFMGFLGATGRELQVMAALYPVLMIIVGTSDIIHVMSKYIDELNSGKPKDEAIQATFRQIGLAVLLTSLTTAVGFLSLTTSRVPPIRDFGFNAAIGVMIAYLTVITFTIALLSFFPASSIIRSQANHRFWKPWLLRVNTFTIVRRKAIVLGTFVILAICAWGISLINTNYNIITNLPRGKQITADFRFFEKELAGFRPFEFAITAKPPYKATDYAIVHAVDKLETRLRQESSVRAIGSITTLYKSIHQMNNRYAPNSYTLPTDSAAFNSYNSLLKKLPQQTAQVLISRDGTKTRLSSRIDDIGADSIKALGLRMDEWIKTNLNPTVVEVRRTGTGLIIDKNAEYIRDSLIKGLGMAILIISVLMAFVFRDWRMIIITLIPNFIPLLLAGAILGFANIELEAGTAIVFAVIFGIAIDDTIHFLSKYRLLRAQGMNTEEAIAVTFTETGKAIFLTSIILFFGFLVMLFSIHPPSVTIGILISSTLISALACDLLLIPILIRWLVKK